MKFTKEQRDAITSAVIERFGPDIRRDFLNENIDFQEIVFSVVSPPMPVRQWEHVVLEQINIKITQWAAHSDPTVREAAASLATIILDAKYGKPV